MEKKAPIIIKRNRENINVKGGLPNKKLRTKDALYKSEQYEIIDKIMNILELDKNNSILLYNLDKDKEKQDSIMELVPDIKKYFRYKTFKGVSDPESSKRPYVSVIRQCTKERYKMLSVDSNLKLEDGSIVRTKKHVFQPLE